MKVFFVSLVFFSSFVFAKPGPGNHYCRPSSTTLPCRFELALICGEGYIDGCLTQQTRTHRCVLKAEGASCAEEVQILCPDGFRDGCELNTTTRHQCVPVAGPSCEERGPDCPEGFRDDCETRE